MKQSEGIGNECDFCRQKFNKDYEYKCPYCGLEVAKEANHD